MAWTATGATRLSAAFASTGIVHNTTCGGGPRRRDWPNSFQRHPSFIMGGGSISHSASPCDEGGDDGRPARTGLIIDTDVGFDDIFAIRCLSLVPGRDVEVDDDPPRRLQPPAWSLVTTVGGISPPGYGAECIRRLFPSHHVVAGRTSIRPRGADPEWLRDYREKLHLFVEGQSSGDELSFIKRANEDNNGCDDNKDDSALIRVHDALRGSRDGSVDLLCLGPLTNLAHWIESHGPLLERKLRGIWIMGGNEPAPGGLGGAVTEHEPTSEFNFARDPAAAAAVLASPGLSRRVHLVTQEQSSRARFDDARTSDGHGCNGPVGRRSLEIALAKHAEAEAPGGLLSRILGVDPGAVYYDPVAAYASVMSSKSEFLRCGHVPVRVDPTSGAVLPAPHDEVDESGDGQAVRFVSDIALTGEGGYLEWIRSAIKRERADILKV